MFRKDYDNFEEACEVLRTTDRMMKEADAAKVKSDGGPSQGQQSQTRSFHSSYNRPSHSFGPTGGIGK